MTVSRWGGSRGQLESQRLQIPDVLVVGAFFVQQVLQSAANTADLALSILKMHANARRDETEFIGSIEMGLESLDVGEKP